MDLDGRFRWGTSTFRPLVSTARSNGALSVVEVREPALAGPPRHVHRTEDETFVVLAGEVEFEVAGQRLIRGAGEVAFVPRGTEHAYRTLTEARMIVTITPGGFEAFFAEMAAGEFRIPEDMPQVLDSAARHNLDFTGPPL